MTKIAVIGGGIFGVTTALELSKYFKVTLFETKNNLLCGASTNNHLRHHQGYHYPRSEETVLEVLRARKSFEIEYSDCIVNNFPAYYGISKHNSKTSKAQFLEFCEKLKLNYTICMPDKKYINQERINLCVKVPEEVYNLEKLKETTLNKLKKSRVLVKLEHKIVGGKAFDKEKELEIIYRQEKQIEKFDCIVNATYCDFNTFNKWFCFPKKKVLYELVELLEITLPVKEKIGLTIIDGEFSSLLPRSENTFTLGHVKESVLESVISNELDIEKFVSNNKKSNWKKIVEEGSRDFPIVKNAELIKSILVTRVVKADVENTDERPTEIIDHNNNIYSIFAGKIVTCVETAKEIAKKIKEKN